MNEGNHCNKAELKDVLHVPDLEKNICSASAILRKRLKVKFGKANCIITDLSSTVLGYGKLEGKNFVLDTVVMNDSCRDAHSAKNGRDRRSMAYKISTLEP